jgi:phosphoserine phosphatase
MHRLAAPEALATLLHEIIEVGKSAIVAEEGVLWLWDGPSGELTIVVPAAGEQGGARSSLALARDCGTSLGIINIPDCRNDDRFKASPVQAGHFEVRSLLNVPVLGRDSSLLGVMQWLGSEPGQFDRHDEWLAPALAAQAAVAIQHSRMTDELLANAILQQEVAVAKEIQMSTLPETMPEVPGYDVHGHFLPTSHTGGDLFDLALLNDRLFMLLGDATGHGFGPALSATQMQAMLRVAFRCGTDLGRAYMHVNNQLNEDLPDDRFITAFIGFLDPVRHEVEFHSGGQGPILHFHAADNTCEWHTPTSFPLGIMELDGTAPSRKLSLEAGDVLALISDGLYEFAAADGSQFGEPGVAALIREGHELPMADLCRRLVDAAFAFGSGAPQADDITLVLVRRLPQRE